MKLRAFVPILFASIFLLFQGCKNEKGIFELFQVLFPVWRFQMQREAGIPHPNLCFSP